MAVQPVAETFLVSLRDKNPFFYRRDPVSLSIPPPHTHLLLAEYRIPLSRLQLANGLGRLELVLTTPSKVLTIRPAPGFEHDWPTLLHLLRLPRAPRLPRYTLLAELGRGAFGVVHKASLPNGGIVAVKRVSKKRLRGRPAALVATRREVAIGKALPPHANIARVLHVQETPNDFFLVMECVSGGSLLEFVQQRRLSFAVVCAIMEQLLAAVAHLHSYHVMHRDIKLENVLVEDADVPLPHVKLCDLGLAIEERALRRERACRASVGTGYAQAPEMVLEPGQVGGGAGYGRAVDVWACGIVLFTMLYRRVPWRDETGSRYERMKEMRELSREMKTSIHVVQTEEERAWTPPELQSLLCGLLQPEPGRRLSARAALEHAAFMEYLSDEEEGEENGEGRMWGDGPPSLRRLATHVMHMLRTVESLNASFGRTGSRRAVVL